MSQNAQKRFILPCKYKGAQKRIYLVWQGEGDGVAEIRTAMTEFGDCHYDPNVSAAAHFKNITEFLRHRGFTDIKA